MNFEKTIAAVSTPYGKGGIAVIRISGKDAYDITSKIFAPKSTHTNPCYMFFYNLQILFQKMIANFLTMLYNYGKWESFGISVKKPSAVR